MNKKKASAPPVIPAETQELLRFIDASPTPYHAVAGALRELSGFRLLDERKAWSLKPGGRYAVVRNHGSLIAFIAGSRPPSESGFKLIGAHTDSPNLRLKPEPVFSAEGYAQLGVEVYGGALLGTWTDRDLSVAGYLVVDEGGGSRRVVLTRLGGAVCRVPQLAIHLNRDVNSEGLKLNTQRHLPPVFALAGKKDPRKELFGALAAAAGVDAKKVVAFDLQLFDVQPSAVAGLDGEFIHAPRLDNLASSHAALRALAASAGGEETQAVVLYDHEEVGSRSAHGAGSPFLSDVLERLVGEEPRPREALARAIQRSLLISADMAHAVHPNYAEVHEPRHKPRLNGGPVIKVNHEQSYATSGETAAAFEACCRAAKVPVQKFVVRTDMRCGGTIGAISAANLGLKTVDVGNPMLSMHSIREMAGTHDHPLMIRAFEAFFKARG